MRGLVRSSKGSASSRGFESGHEPAVYAGDGGAQLSRDSHHPVRAGGRPQGSVHTVRFSLRRKVREDRLRRAGPGGSS